MARRLTFQAKGSLTRLVQSRVPRCSCAKASVVSDEASRIEEALAAALAAGHRPPDLAGPDAQPMSTESFTEAVLENL